MGRKRAIHVYKHNSKEVLTEIRSWSEDIIYDKILTFLKLCENKNKTPFLPNFYRHNDIIITRTNGKISSKEVGQEWIDVIKKIAYIKEVFKTFQEQDVVNKALNKDYSASFAALYLANRFDYTTAATGQQQVPVQINIKTFDHLKPKLIETIISDSERAKALLPDGYDTIDDKELIDCDQSGAVVEGIKDIDNEEDIDMFEGIEGIDY